MGLKVASVLIVLISIAIFLVYQSLLSPLPAPNLSTTRNWGPSKRANQIPTGIISYRVQYPPAVIEELRKKLSEPLRLHRPLEGVGFRYGFQKNILDELVTYWRENYLKRWDERQAFLNSFPHFTTEIQGLNIHFIHAKSSAKKTVPLLLLHGWPGSVREFYELIPKLIAPNNEGVGFEVIAPSLPGFGWSESASKPGLGPAEAAVIVRNLMIKLGHKKFLIQGGDWGSAIGTNVAVLFPENVIGFHSNTCVALSLSAYLKGFVASFYPSYFIPKEYVDFVFPLGQSFSYLIEESGYFHIQATKPDTIGVVLSNNPVGMAAYILEKFSTWTNPAYRLLDDGGLNNNDFSRDALMDNLMIYYLTNSITTSMRFYAESFSDQQRGHNLDRVPTDVAVGCARFKNDIKFHALDWQLKDKFRNLVHSTYYTDGGHFIALQKPDVLYKDFVDFVGKLSIKV